MKTLRAHGFNQRPRFEQVVGYLERKEPLPLDQPDRKATSFITSHFYLDDFVQSSEDPNPQPLQHTPLQAIFFFRGASSRTKAGENSQGRDLEATPPQKGNNPKASRGPDPRNQKRGKTKRAKNPRGAGLDPRELFR